MVNGEGEQSNIVSEMVCSYDKILWLSLLRSY